MTDLETYIQNAPLIDTHEHPGSEKAYVENAPDILQDLFGNYVIADLIVAGLSPETLEQALDTSNVYVDICWAWGIDPVSSMTFIRKFIHSVPRTKLLALGGDIFLPGATLAYSLQARNWLTRTLQTEIDAGL